MADFVHLHNHTHYSLLDALTKPEELVKTAKANGHKAVALTDHGVMFGVIEFYEAAKKAGIKPLIGVEAYMANGSRHDRSSMKSDTRKKNYYHVLLIAKNETGYKNLIKLTSAAFTEGFYYKPRIDKELLERYHKGLICTSGCMGGVVSTHLINDDYNKALEEAKFYKELFGDDFYIEIQNHFIPGDEVILRAAPKIASEIGAKLVATNDIHYLKKDHAEAHNVHLHINSNMAPKAGEVDVKKLRYRTPEFYFKSTEEMAELFKDYPEAIKNTVEIADKCDLEIDLNTLHMPDFPIPETSKATNLEEYLEELVYEGLERKFDSITEEIDKRAKYELDIINTMGFPGYFLIVWDFIRAAKTLDVPVGPGRGSAAGSIVAYALDITNVDPLKFDLLFERFLNPERVSMPDIDIDFCDTKRDRVINYVKEQYGNDAVAQIITFGKLSSKAVLTDVGRVLGIELPLIKSITKLIPVTQGKVMKLEEAVKLPEIKEIIDNNGSKLADLIEYSLVLEGTYRSAGTHAAGVVIAPGDITNYVPLYQAPKTKGQSVEVATQYSMSYLEKAGLLKMDFLGLKTLSIIENTLEMVKRNHGEEIDIDSIYLEDPKTYDVLGNGDTLAVFQFESGGMQKYLKQLKPQSIDEIAAMNALYRPGPMDNIPEFIDRKFGNKPITYLHPIMESALKTTYGIIVYQEQVMKLVQDIAGFTLGQADILRRAMSKKLDHIMDSMKPDFIQGAAEKNIDKKLALEIFSLIAKFAKYGFNKSHAVAYSYVAYQTAYLKAHYPAEFIAANMTSEINDNDKIVQLIEEANKFGIEVLPPDVNKSFTAFSALPDGKSIVFGFSGIKNVGIPAAESIVRERDNGPYTSLFDFVSRVDTRLINKRCLEALISVGAFDSLKAGHRVQLLNSIETALDYARKMSDNSSLDMDSLFMGDTIESTVVEPQLADVEPVSEREMLDMEKEYVNYYISGHPLDSYETEMSMLKLIETDTDPASLDPKNEYSVCGVITGINRRRDRNDKTYAFVTIEDKKGRAECILWSDTFEEFEEYVKPDAVVVCTGNQDKSAESLKIICKKLISLEKAVLPMARGYVIWIDMSNSDSGLLEKLKVMMNGTGTKIDIDFNVYDNEKGKKRRYHLHDAAMSLSFEMTKKLKGIFGTNKVKYMV
ncbi:MAG: DNA polymerase III subunit alpha [Candidatus Kapaibacterium sp.]